MEGHPVFKFLMASNNNTYVKVAQNSDKKEKKVLFNVGACNDALQLNTMVTQQKE
jgi:hypothetical protein